MRAEPNNAQEGIDIDKEVIENKEKIMVLMKIQKEMEIFEYKFGVKEYTETEKNSMMIKFGSDKFIERWLDAEREGYYDMASIKNCWKEQIKKLEKKRDELDAYTKEIKIKKLENEIKNLKNENEYKLGDIKCYTGYLNSGFSYKVPKKVVCYRCNEIGHTAPFCRSELNKTDR
ncbi:hypothetical protein BDAP_000511 [Binucleata daphniae]